MVDRKIDYKTNVKNALVITLIGALTNNVPDNGFYKYSRGVLKKYGIDPKNRRNIDTFAKTHLLGDSRIEEILKKYKPTRRFSSSSNISNISFGTIYLYMRELYHGELEKKFGVKRRFHVPTRILYHADKVSKNKRAKGISIFKLPINRRKRHNTR